MDKHTNYVSINANSNVIAWWIINPNLTINNYLHNQFIWDSLSSNPKINTLNIIIPQARCWVCLALVFLWSSFLVSWGILCCREVLSPLGVQDLFLGQHLIYFISVPSALSFDLTVVFKKLVKDFWKLLRYMSNNVSASFLIATAYLLKALSGSLSHVETSPINTVASSLKCEC